MIKLVCLTSFGESQSREKAPPRRMRKTNLLWRPMKLQPSLSPVYLSEVSCDEPAAATSV
jgi:hypothetical protein